MREAWQMFKFWFSARKTLFTSLIGTGGYVLYKDSTRNKHMVEQFRLGNILAPCNKNEYETIYMHRPELESKLRHVLGPQFTNEYYLVKGEVGSGKSRLLVEIIRRMVAEEGSKKLGAPVYVHASQGKHFSDTLGKAVHFDFDEHINFKFFFKYLFQIDKFPARDNHNKLTRVLDAVESSAYEFTHRYGRPVVLVIDGLHILTQHFPGALEKLQEKAKFWADTNICKVVFVSNEEDTEYILQRNGSAWSRVAPPIYVEDFSQSESIAYLQDRYLGTTDNSNSGVNMSDEKALYIYNQLGGNPHYLTLLKRDHHLKIPIEESIDGLKQKELEKIRRAATVKGVGKVIDILSKSPNMTIDFLSLARSVSPEVIDKLVSLNILKYERRQGQVFVAFESKLTASAVSIILDKESESKES